MLPRRSEVTCKCGRAVHRDEAVQVAASDGRPATVLCLYCIEQGGFEGGGVGELSGGDDD